MNTGIGGARVGQWYLRWDTGDVFRVTGLNRRSGTIEIASFDDDRDELDERVWTSLPLQWVDPSSCRSGPTEQAPTEPEALHAGEAEPTLSGATWAAPYGAAIAAGWECLAEVLEEQEAMKSERAAAERVLATSGPPQSPA